MAYRSTKKCAPDLLIQAKDTDPDLRFMALNDLEKEIGVTSGPIIYLNRYADTILKCLDDEFVEVRTQSLKCFETVGPKLGNIVLYLIAELMMRIKKPKKTSITSSIYTMALHNLLQNLPCAEPIYLQAIDLIVPEILSDKKAFYLEIDYIEILTDVCEYLGKYLSKQNGLDILLFLSNAIFEADNIISKKSIVTANILLKNITDSQIVSGYLKQLLNNYQEHVRTDMDESKIKLLTALSGSISGNHVLFQEHLTFLWKTAVDNLELKTLQVVDEDYELQQRKDNLRVEAILLLEKLFAYLTGTEAESLVPRTMEICESLISYDPYQDNVPDEEGNDEDSDYYDEDGDEDGDEYGYEQDENDDNDCNSAWKLRVEAFALLIVLITNFPVKLPLIFGSIFSKAINLLSAEKHTIVLSKLVETLSLVFELSSETGTFYNLLRSKELLSASCKRRNSDVSLYTEEDPYAYLSCNSNTISEAIIKFIEDSNSFVNEKPGLVITLISNWVSAVGNSSGYVEKLVVAVNKAWKTQLMSTDIFTFYFKLIKNNPLEQLGSGLQYLISYLHKCLSEDSNHRLVNESLTLLTEIYQGDQHQSDDILTQLAKSFAPLLMKRVINRNVSTEIRLKSLNTLVTMLLITEMDTQISDEILQIFRDTLATEVLSLKSLTYIVEIAKSSKLRSKLSQPWIKGVIR
ncbi:hypothetical protein CANINC_002247 [Pichia inconspicua]|uniref:TATA-binding protein interacting (TIP20) domain-containing protein n=1 Tax=Pichia inconspicua TaxID=52247 RepID=A0A4T0X2Y5_9ASCO|nr:hypothetical protein CANINC_002247 [[Candida] inconspicua]